MRVRFVKRDTETRVKKAHRVAGERRESWKRANAASTGASASNDKTGAAMASGHASESGWVFGPGDGPAANDGTARR